MAHQDLLGTTDSTAWFSSHLFRCRMRFIGLTLEQLLPTELWLAVFALLAPRISFEQRQMLHKQIQKYSCHLLIPILRQETAVSVLLSIEKSFRNIKMLQLLESSPTATKLLAALVCPALQAVCLRNFQKCELLPKFAQLTSCVLQLEEDEAVYIEDLKQLPLLTDLHLQGGHFLPLDKSVNK